MEHPRDFPTAADYAQSTANDAADAAGQALARVKRLELALAGDVDARRAIFAQMQDEIAAAARPKPPAPTMADFLKQAYSAEQIQLANDKANEALAKMFPGWFGE